jgi:hypothetical protein
MHAFELVFESQLGWRWAPIVRSQILSPDVVRRTQPQSDPRQQNQTSHDRILPTGTTAPMRDI